MITKMTDREYREKAAAFHGHVCGGLTAEPFCLFRDGKPVCRDCFEKEEGRITL